MTRLIPFKHSALTAMLQGELRYTPEGWVSSVGIAGCWNSHVIRYLAGKGYCVIRGSRAAITASGRAALRDLELAA